MIHQEKHTTGHLWWKKTWYRYFRYSDEINAMLPVTVYPQKTIDSLEKK